LKSLNQKTLLLFKTFKERQICRGTLRYIKGDIVILELSFMDLLGSKLRPVLVLNAIDLGNNIIVAK
jgi:hypothetical protein